MMFLLGDADQERESLADDVAVAVGGVEVMPESRDVPGPDCLADLGEFLVSGPDGDAPLRVDGQVVGLLATRATPGDAP